MRSLSDESGQTVIFAALSMVVLIAFLGFAIDVGHLRNAKRHLQADADAAALAAAREIRVCGVKYPGNSACPYMTAAAQSALAENEPGYSNSNFLTGCSGSPGSALTLELNSKPCALGASDPNNNKAGYVEAVVSKQEQMYFAQILGINNIPISARAEASRNPSPACVYALDPTGPNAISLTVGAIIQFKCAVVDESNSPLALANLVCLLVSAPKISVAGDAFTLLALGCPNVQTKVPPPTPADPLAYLPPPSNANAPCGTTTSSPYFGSPKQVNITLGLLQPPVVLNPGVYCGGISINAAALGNITFNPVTDANPAYVLRDGPGYILSIGILGVEISLPSPTPTGGLNIDISALSSITGNGVMFYNEGSSVTAAGGPGNAANSTPQALGCLPLSPAGGFCITVPSVLGLSNFSFSAPTTGEYAGVLFFQAHNVMTSNSFNSLLSGNPFNGAIYAPDATVNYAVNAVSANNNILVAKDISFGLAGLITTFGGANAAGSLGSPLVGDDAVLVQ